MKIGNPAIHASLTTNCTNKVQCGQPVQSLVWVAHTAGLLKDLPKVCAHRFVQS